jgi:integrase
MNTAPRPRRKRNRKKFDEQNVLKLPAKRRQYHCWDEGTNSQRGLGILISPTGTRSYRCIFYYPGSSKPYSMHLGRVGEMSLAEARELAGKARKRAREGFDPKGGDLTPASFQSAVEEYVRHYQIGEKQNATALECQRILLKACTEWHKRQLATIRVQEIGQLLRSIRDGDGTVKPRPYQANKVFNLLRAFFAWCVKPDVGKLRSSPMIGMTKPFAREKARERFFNEDEIKSIWLAANKIGGVEGRFVQMLLLTGKRKGALSRMKWEEIDSTWFWEPPKSEHRNKRLHPIPLPSLAQHVLRSRQQHGFVFPGPVENTHYIDDGVLRNKVRRESGITDFMPHALRHTVETQMGKLRIPPHIRDLLFDHRSARGAGGGYDHHDYMIEMREAMENWSQYVKRLVLPQEVPTHKGNPVLA